jgi:hypothetical protein
MVPGCRNQQSGYAVTCCQSVDCCKPVDRLSVICSLGPSANSYNALVVMDACIAGRPVRFGLLSRGIAIARDMFAMSRE